MTVVKSRFLDGDYIFRNGNNAKIGLSLEGTLTYHVNTCRNNEVLKRAVSFIISESHIFNGSDECIIANFGYSYSFFKFNCFEILIICKCFVLDLGYFLVDADFL